MKTTAILCGLVLVLILSGPAPAEDWRASTRELLAETKVNIHFEDTTLAEALGFLANYSGIHISIDPEVYQQKSENELLVTLRAEHISVGDAVKLITLVKGVAYDLRWGGVFVTTPERLGTLPRIVRFPYLVRDSETNKLLAKLQKKVTYQFEDTPIKAVVEFFSTLTETNIIVLPEVYERSEVKVTASTADLPLLHALCQVLLPRGLGFRPHLGVVAIGLAPEDWSSAWKTEAEERLGKTKVNLAFAETPLRDAIGFLDQMTPVPIHIDPGALKDASGKEHMVSVKLQDVSIRGALDNIATVCGLTWDLRWEVAFVSTPERIRHMRKKVLPAPGSDMKQWERALRHALAGPVTFDFDGVTPANAMEFFRELKGINIVMEPKAREKTEALAMTLRVSDMTLENALSLLLVPRGLTFELKSEVLLVRLR